MNKRKLMGIMAERGDTQEKLAKVLGISLSRLNAKLNERAGAAFTQAEITAIIARYELTPEVAMIVFFTPKLS